MAHLSIRRRPNLVRSLLLIITLVGLSVQVYSQSIPASPKRWVGQSNAIKRAGVQRSAWTEPSDRPHANLNPQPSSHPRLPNPIRQADHIEPTFGPPILDSDSAIDSESNVGVAAHPGAPMVGSHWQSGEDVTVNELRQPPTHRHPILRAPATEPPPTHHSRHAKSAGKGSRTKLVHPPYSSHRRRIQPAPAMLPGGRERPTWKSPYSYGYFGASGTRHWSLHYGYRDRYTEWRLQ